MQGDELADRLLDFAVRIIEGAAALSKSPTGRHIAVQIVDSGTSIGAHYEEARGAESKADLLHKRGLALKECRETRYWLEVINRAKLLSGNFPNALLVEADALCAILGPSILTARGKGK